jgi:threonine dehydrogenase-like Zn-dependent dehydrogenase
MTNMKTISLNGTRDVSVIDAELDTWFDQSILMRVISSGLCAADKHLWAGNHPWKLTFPIVPGHELFGEVVEVDENLSDAFPVGSKIAVQVIVPCYECEFCEVALFNMCSKKRHFGSTYKGGFAEYVKLPKGARIHKFRGPIEDRIGGLAESMANAIYCVHRSKLKSKDSTLILGMGSIGASLAMYLKNERDDVRVTVLTSSLEKQDILTEHGIDFVSSANIESNLNRFDVVFETSGFPGYLQSGLKMIRPRGIFVQYGVFEGPVSVDLNQIGEFKELTMIGGHLANDASFEESLDFLMKNQQKLGFLISNVVGFNNFASAFDSPKMNLFKTIFQPSYEGN